MSINSPRASGSSRTRRSEIFHAGTKNTARSRSSRPCRSVAPTKEKREKKEKPKQTGGSKAIEKKIKSLEREIEKQETLVAEFDEKIAAASADYQELARLMEEKQAEEEKLTGMMDEWEALSLAAGGGRMTLVILAAVFAVLGIALIVIPFHVAMTGICFLGLSAVCILLRLLRGKKHERTWRVILLTLTGACMLTVFGAMAYIDRSGRSDTFEAGERARNLSSCSARRYRATSRR